MLTRRNFLKVFALGSVASALTGAFGINYFSERLSPKNEPIENIVTHAPEPQYRYKLEQVRSGEVPPELYLDERFRLLPEVQGVVGSGMLKGFLYNATDSQLESMAMTLLQPVIPNANDLEIAVKSTVEAVHRPKRKSAFASLFPSVTALYGKEIPAYLTFGDQVLNSKVLNNEADIRGAIGHELKHIEDWHYGIKLGNLHISGDDIISGAMSLEFFENLCELRATYKELEAAYKDVVSNGVLSVSKEYFGVRAHEYMKHYDYIKNNAATELERKASSLQLEALSGIKPRRKGELILLYMDLFGRKQLATVKGIQ